MKVKRWQLLLLSVLVIASMMFTVLPSPIPFGGAGVASAATSTSYKVDASLDDSLQVADTTQFTVLSYIQVCSNGSTVNTGAYRWKTGTFPPAGSNITACTLQVYTYSTSYDSLDCDVYFQKAATTAAFSTTLNDILARTKTFASVRWTFTNSGVGWQTSPDLKAVLQEVVDLYTTTSLVAILVPRNNGDANGMASYSYDQGSTYGGNLSVTYTPKAPTIHTDAATSIATTTATINGEITSPGGENPTVTMYWGLTDGGTTEGNWQNSSAPTSPAQPQGVAAFYKDVTGLEYNKTYFFTAKGVNSGGTAWATTGNFTTVATTFSTTVSTGADDGYRKSDGTFVNNEDAFVLAGMTIPGNISHDGFIRFQNVTVPKNATITNAYLWYRSKYESVGTPCMVSIYAEDAGNATAVTSYADYTNRAKTLPAIYSDPLPSWTAGTWYYSVSLEAVVQAVVSRSDWATGNSMQFFTMDNFSNSWNWEDEPMRIPYAYEKGAGYRPTLYIYYTTTTDYATIKPTAAADVSYSSALISGNSTLPSTTQWSVVYDTVTHSAANRPGNVTPSAAGYASYLISAVGSYATFSTTLTGLDSPNIYYFRVAVTDGTNWYYGAEVSFSIGIFYPSIRSYIAHDLVSDGTYIYYSYTGGNETTGRIAKINPETMLIVGSEWTGTPIQGLAYDGTNLYGCTWTEPAYVYKINTSTMTTTATWTGASGQDKASLFTYDDTCLYVPYLNLGVAKIYKGNMTTAATYTDADFLGFCAVLQNGRLYIGGASYGHPIVEELYPGNMTLANPTKWVGTSSAVDVALRLVGDGTYVYAGAGSGDPALPSEIWKIDPTTMTDIGNWTGTDVGMWDGSGVWGLAHYGEFLLSVACSTPTTIFQIDLSDMSLFNSWTVTGGANLGGDCLILDSLNNVYIGLDDIPALALRANRLLFMPNISNSPAEKDFGTVQPSTYYWGKSGTQTGPSSWPLVTADCIGNVVNTSLIPINVLFSMSAMTGGITWNPGTTAGTNLFVLKAGIAGVANEAGMTKLSTTPQKLITNLPAGDHIHWEFVFYPPTNLITNNDQAVHTGYLTLATEAYD